MQDTGKIFDPDGRVIRLGQALTISKAESSTGSTLFIQNWLANCPNGSACGSIG